MPRFQGWVVKLGGSLGDSPRLMPWLSALAQPAARCIVVPGGGRFADAVRMAQADWGLADDAAHAMALLAMAQYGLALHARAPTLAVARGLEGLEKTDPTGPRLWLPELADQLALDRDGLPRDWSLSSDSLALWLANRLDAKALVLVKSLEGQGTWNCTAAQLQDFSAQGVLDNFFPNLRPACPVHVLAAGCDPGNLPGLCSSAG